VTNRKAGEFFYSLGIVFAAQSLQNKMQITFHINQTYQSFSRCLDHVLAASITIQRDC